MLYNEYTPYSGGVLTVQIASHVSIPDRVDFVYGERTVSVDFWLVQTIRQAVPMLTPSLDDYNAKEKENKLMFIKALRQHLDVGGLKECKDVAEWFINNVDRGISGKL